MGRSRQLPQGVVLVRPLLDCTRPQTLAACELTGTQVRVLAFLSCMSCMQAWKCTNACSSQVFACLERRELTLANLGAGAMP